MTVNPVTQAYSAHQPGAAKADTAGKADFGTMLKEELNKVNGMQVRADEAMQQLVTGEADNIHSVMLAAEEARLALEMTVQIRNKLVESYQEINRMQL